MAIDYPESTVTLHIASMIVILNVTVGDTGYLGTMVLGPSYTRLLPMM